MLFYVAQCTTPTLDSPLSDADKVQIRWFVGLEFGSNFTQLEVLESVVANFNASQDEIELQMEVASIAGAYDLFATEISSGNGPDIVGPISWGMASGFPN
jgi:multiple sugar transport system substrate-binding protein